MAKNNKETVNLNQMSLFDTLQKEEVKFINSVKETPVVEESIPMVVEEVKVEVLSTISSDDSISSFLKSKDVSFEISGQVEMTREEFTNSNPENSRFVSISVVGDDKVLVTPTQEDGSLTLKIMKDNFPNYVTQLQKVDEMSFIDSLDNIDLLDKLERIIEGKKIAAIKDSGLVKNIEKELLSNNEVDVDLDAEIEIQDATPEVSQVKKDRYKP